MKKPRSEQSHQPLTETIIHDWLVLGSFAYPQWEKILGLHFLPEEQLAPSPGQKVAHFTWRRAEVGANHVLDFLAQPFSARLNCGAYAFTYVHAAESCSAKLLMSSDDGVAAWLNGELVWSHNLQRPVTPREDVASVHLQKGWNRLLCKVSQCDGGWGLFCAIAAPVAVRLDLTNPCPKQWPTPQSWGGQDIVGADVAFDAQGQFQGLDVITYNRCPDASGKARITLSDAQGQSIASVLCVSAAPFTFMTSRIACPLEAVAAAFGAGQATLQIGQQKPQKMASLAPEAGLRLLLLATRAEHVEQKLATLSMEVETTFKNYDLSITSILAEVRAGLVALAARDVRGVRSTMESLLRALLQAIPDRKNEKVHVVGHAHIDMNWLWTYPETVNTCHDSFRQAIAFMEEFPDFTFLQSQPSTYRAVEALDAPLFKRIQKHVQEGRWELVGGMYSEGDTNLSSGEALVRSFLLGQRYFLDRFHKQAVVGWLPDNFGHVAQLPQILRLAGCEFFYCARCAPHMGTFWWKAPNGSRVLCYSNGSYSGSVTTSLEKDLIRLTPHTRRLLHMCGVGDHGGGPTRKDIEGTHQLHQTPKFPSVRFDTAEGFFRTAMTEMANQPTHTGEMQYIFEGCYTSIARVKQGNRHCESALTSAEFLASLRQLTGEKYPAEDLRRAWEIVVFNQFHDILCGSAINESNADSVADYKWALSRAESVRNASLRCLADEVQVVPRKGQPVVVMNTMPQSRRTLVEAEVFTHQLPATAVFRGWGNVGQWNKIFMSQETASVMLRDPQGKTIPAQIVWGKVFPPGFRWKVQFVAENLPAGGYRTYYLDSTQPGQLSTAIPEKKGEFQTDDFQVGFDLKTGDIRRLYDKRTKSEWVAKGSRLNVLKVYQEAPHGMSAWTIGPITRTETVVDVESVTIVERGPVRVCVEAVKRWGKSKFIQRTYVYRSYPRIDFELEAHWFEQGTDKVDAPMLRAIFPLALKNPRFDCHTPFAVVSRPTTGQEVPAQQWVDVTDGKKGAALLTQTKYGYSVNQNELRLTLLRSSYDPDIYPDQGVHRIRYALLPHAGDWKQGDVWNEGEIFSSAPLATEPPSLALGQKHATRPEEASLLELSPKSVALSGLKQSEDGDQLIARFVETEGRTVKATLTLPVPVKSAKRLDLIEKPLAGAKPPTVKNRAITVTLQPFEIVTLGIVTKKNAPRKP